MAVKWDQWFGIPFEMAFPKGAALIGEIEPMFEWSDRKKTYTDKPAVDPVSGLRMWRARLMDPSDGIRGAESGIDLVFLAEVRPVPVHPEVMEGFRPIELEGLMVQPRAVMNGQRSKLVFIYRATGIKGDNSGKVAPGDHSASAPRDRKAAA
ncbi:hypothetical protein ACWIGW_22195 [Nocardia brasiliensis]